MQHLAHFYRTLPPANLSTADYLFTIESELQFYKAYRACLRAKLAIWHMKEPGGLKRGLEASAWFERVRTYLHLAEKFLP